MKILTYKEKWLSARTSSKILVFWKESILYSTATIDTLLGLLSKRGETKKSSRHLIKNLLFDGLDEAEGGSESSEHSAEKVQRLVREKLGITDTILIDSARRIGRRTQNRPRSILVNFRNFPDRQAILRNSKKLKGTNLFVNEDLCEETRRQRREQLPRLREARSAGKIAYFQRNKLIVRDNLSSEPVEDQVMAY